MAAYKDGMTLAECLAEEISSRGYSSARAAAPEMGVDPSTLTRWLNGQPPDDDRVETLSAFLKLSRERVVQLVHEARVRRKVKGNRAEERSEARSGSAKRMPAARSGIALPDDLTDEEQAALDTVLAGIWARRGVQPPP